MYDGLVGICATELYVGIIFLPFFHKKRSAFSIPQCVGETKRKMTVSQFTDNYAGVP